jgi:hypothetical protein
VIGRFFFACKKIKRSQPSAAPTGERIPNVGAAEGCDLLILTTGQTGHANFALPPCIQEKPQRRLRLHWTYR